MLWLLTRSTLHECGLGRDPLEQAEPTPYDEGNQSAPDDGCGDRRRSDADEVRTEDLESGGCQQPLDERMNETQVAYGHLSPWAIIFHMWKAMCSSRWSGRSEKALDPR